MQSNKNNIKLEDALVQSEQAEKEHALSLPSQSLLGLLDELQGSAVGSVLYSQLERILGENEQDNVERDQLYRFWLRLFLAGYIRHLKPGSTVHIHAKLIYKQLEKPLTSTAIKGLRKHMNMFSMHLGRMDMLDDAILKNTLEPVLAYYGASSEVEPTVADDKGMPDAQAESVREPAGAPTSDPIRDQERALKGMIDDMLPGEDKKDSEQKLTTTYRQYLNTQYRDTERVQSMLAKHIRETIDQGKQFGDILQAVRHGLNEAETIGEIDILRECLVEDINNLTDSHVGMVEKLAETKDYLKMIEIDSRKLSDELARVRLLSLTDELTELPNRRAFMRRLEDEMSRTKRYGANLALVIMDLDSFKAINDKYGHAIGDAVLCCYADDVLTTFRHHDLVARYGGEEFAVLLPNTDKAGALAALTKVRQQSDNQVCSYNGTKIRVPTFSAGLALYVPGESANSFIQRADDALYSAKRLGRNRTEVSTGEQTSNLHNEINGHSPDRISG
ncbi:MAG: GGDEF domain-containing protein [Gammaproteobacteria bacterium]|nr:GGDEF domain-containing protein [Gammaproteobacteria bacterium]